MIFQGPILALVLGLLWSCGNEGSTSLDAAPLVEYDTDPMISGLGFGGNFGLFPFTNDGTILASDEN